jgi:hypothetical protein
MSVKVTNRSRALITVQLNSGEAIHLAPRETSRPIEDFEVRHNSHLLKLVDRRLVDVTEGGQERASAETRKRPKPDKR